MKKGRPGITDNDLHALADGQLPPDRVAAVEAHLAAHPADAARLADWRAQAARLHAVFGPVIDEPVPLRLSPSRVAARQERRRPNLAAVASLAFAAGLGVGGLGVMGLVSLDRRPVPAIAAIEDANDGRSFAVRALAAHRTYTVEVRHPVEVPAAEEAHLVQWLSKRLDYAIRVPDLGAEGFTLLGGRLLAHDDGPAALLMFESQTGERLTLYVTCVSKSREMAFRYTEANGSAAFSWTGRKASYALSGPADRERLHRIARVAYDSLETKEKQRS